MIKMRLLHTTELRFEEFFDANVPPYAILSHRWGDSEVSYQDLMQDRKKDGAGYVKILAFCKRAAADMAIYGNRYGGKAVKGPFDWVWIDTCCIDKSSSAELSEAVNSMYSWYSRSVVCYAYLPDVEISAEPDETMRAFQGSQWFTRGWTLQELLAPSDVVFFSSDWKTIGTRERLESDIAAAAGINAILVNPFYRVWRSYKISAYEKLSWSSGRNTSRLEDQAYCLLGLFDINMPLLYGEGQKATHRFQLEIIRSTHDESIFAGDLDHVSSPIVGRAHISRGLLDHDIQCFRRTKRYLDIRDGLDMDPVEIGRPPYTVTNQGLELRVPTRLAEKDVFFWPLNCRLSQKGFSGVLAIVLGMKLADPDSEPDTWYRKFYKWLPQTLPKLPAVEYEDGSFSAGVYIAPERWLWSRGQLDVMETTLIYVKL